MRVFPMLIFAVLTVTLVFILNTKMLLHAPLGALLYPQHGVWQTAEPADQDFSADFKFDPFTGKEDVSVYDRLLPHVFV